MRNIGQLSGGAAGLCLLAVVVAQAAAQTPATAVLSNGKLKVAVNDPRPLARVVDELEQLCQCAITYEEARLSAKGGRFEFTYGGIQTLVHQRVAGVLTALVHRYGRTRYAGRFAVAITGPMFHVVPAQTAEGQASLRPGVSLLDTPLQFESTVRTVSEALEVVTTALSEATGEKVLLSIPPNFPGNRRVVVEANGEPARDVLVRILTSLQPRPSWRLLYDAAVPAYTLHIHVVRTS